MKTIASPVVLFGEAVRFWLKPGFIDSGGAAGAFIRSLPHRFAHVAQPEVVAGTQAVGRLRHGHAGAAGLPVL